MEYEVSGRSVPARLYGRPEDCHPAECAEVDLVSVKVALPLRTGLKREVDILPALSQDAEEAIMDEVLGETERLDAEALACALEDKADARRDERRGL